jgi:hypothetical protein
MSAIVQNEMKHVGAICTGRQTACMHENRTITVNAHHCSLGLRQSDTRSNLAGMSHATHSQKVPLMA